jgi:hypothetical protein
MRLEKVLNKILDYSVSGRCSMPLPEDFLETHYVVIDQGEEIKVLEELWYCAGAHGLPQNIREIAQKYADHDTG